MGLNFRKMLTAPAAEITDVETRLRVEAFVCIMIFRQVIFAVITVLLIFTIPEHLPSMVPALLINFFCYLGSRTKHYRWAAAVSILEPLIAIPFVTIPATNPVVILSAPMWLVVSPLVSSLLYPTRWTAAVIAVTCVSFAIIEVNIDAKYNYLMLNEFIVMFAISAMALLVNFLREGVQTRMADHQVRAQHSAKLASLGEMAGGVAHELNSPLAAISLNIELIEEEVADLSGDVQPVFEKLRHVTEITERMATVINALRTFARDGETAESLPTPAQNWIQACLDLCQQRFHSAGVQLRIVNQNFETVSQVQQVQMSQALLNLLNNSFDAVGKLDERWIHIEAERSSEFFELRVEDSGSGIPQDLVQRLFQPFFTTKSFGSGVGLGLSVSKGILEKHGGQLIYDSQRSHTCFVMRLPILKEAA